MLSDTGVVRATLDEEGRTRRRVYLYDHANNSRYAFDLVNGKVLKSVTGNTDELRERFSISSTSGDPRDASRSARDEIGFGITAFEAWSISYRDERRGIAGHFQSDGNGNWEHRVGGDLGNPRLLRERGRDIWSIYLMDPGSEQTVQFDLAQRTVQFRHRGRDGERWTMTAGRARR